MEFDNIVVCYGGEWQNNDDGSCEYVPTNCKRGGVNLDSNINPSKLLGLLESRFKVTHISRLSCKFSTYLYPVDIEYDYDVSLFLKRAEKVNNSEIVFMYVVGEHGDYMSYAIVELNVLRKPCIPDLNISTYEYDDVGGSGCVDSQKCFDLNDDPSVLLEDSSYKSKKRKGRILVCSSSHHLLKKVFMKKEELQLELGIMALTEGFEFITSKSNKQRLEVRCRFEGCEWFLRSRSIKDTEAFHVTSFNDVHTCSKTQMHHNHRNANKKVVAHCIKGLVEDSTRNLKGKDVVNILGQRFNANLSYKQGWKGKVYAESLFVGSSEDSFGKLPIYCHNLEIANPGTRTHILRDDLNRFEMLFIAIGACVTSFIRCLRPVIIIDGAHLKGTFKGTMFLAVGMDGNNQIFPIAYGVGKSESGESWTWFLTKLRECVSDHPNLAIISDRAKSIEVAICIVNIFLFFNPKK